VRGETRGMTAPAPTAVSHCSQGGSAGANDDCDNDQRDKIHDEDERLPLAPCPLGKGEGAYRSSIGAPLPLREDDDEHDRIRDGDEQPPLAPCPLGKGEGAVSFAGNASNHSSTGVPLPLPPSPLQPL
jgi:hypothetical protein